MNALKEIAVTYDLKDDYGASTISRFPEVLVVRKSDEDEESFGNILKMYVPMRLINSLQ